MLKIQCPVCEKSFFWTDDMPAQGKCPNTDCEGIYDIHSALKQNIDRHTGVARGNILRCPFCKEEISSRYTICRHCNHLVLGNITMKKSYVFVAVCILLIGFSLVLQLLVK